MSKKTNHKNLARKQARIKDARRRAYRKRQRILWGVIGGVIVILLAFLVLPRISGPQKASAAASCGDLAPTPTKTFDSEFPMCIDPSIDYAATIDTSKGPIQLDLTPQS